MTYHGMAYEPRGLGSQSLHMYSWESRPTRAVGKANHRGKEDRKCGVPTRNEVCGMQEARVYLELVRERGKKRLPLTRVYRQLFNRKWYLIAYGKIYRNKGAMTQGVTTETVDSMSLTKIDAIINALRQEQYRWKPVRRVVIPKRNSSKTRALGLPTWSDKLLQEVIRLILEAYFEPTFSEHSHGFRPGRGCHTALKDMYDHWAGVTWTIEGGYCCLLRQLVA